MSRTDPRPRQSLTADEMAVLTPANRKVWALVEEKAEHIRLEELSAKLGYNSNYINDLRYRLKFGIGLSNHRAERLCEELEKL